MSQIWVNLSNPHVCAGYFPLFSPDAGYPLLCVTDWDGLQQRVLLPSGFWLDLATGMYQQETGRGRWVRYKSPSFLLGQLLRLTASLDWSSQAPVWLPFWCWILVPSPSTDLGACSPRVPHYPCGFPQPAHIFVKYHLFPARLWLIQWCEQNHCSGWNLVPSIWYMMRFCGVIHSVNKGFPQPLKGDRRLYN